MDFVADAPPDPRLIEAVVVELLPQAKYRVRLANEQLMLVHAASGTEINFVRLRPGDRVRVEISPHDRSRGRIVRLLTKQ